MKLQEGRPFVDKVNSDTREYVQLLLEEIHRLNQTLTDFSSRYVDVEQQNTNLANLYVATYQLHGTLDRDRVLGAIKELIINLIGSEELGIWEINGDALTLLDSFGIDAQKFVNSPVGRELNLRGINAKVVIAGTVSRGDRITRLS